MLLIVARKLRKLALTEKKSQICLGANFLNLYFEEFKKPFKVLAFRLKKLIKFEKNEKCYKML